MLEKISTATIKKYRPTILIWLAIIFFGVWSYTSLLDREGFPPVEIPYATINGAYFIDDVERVDEELVRPIYEQLESIDEVSNIQSTARSDSFGMFVEFEESLTSSEGAELVKNSVEEIAAELPDSADYELSPISATLFNNEFNALTSVYSNDGVDTAELVSSAESLASELEVHEDIRRAEVEDQFTESTNPATGQTERRQTSFSVYGENRNGSVDSGEAVVVGVVAAEGVDDLKLDEAMKSVIDSWSPDNENIEAAVSAGYADIIRTQIGSLENNVLIGMLAIIAVVGLMIGWRASLLATLFVPTVLAATLIGVLASGYTLNTIVLFALVLVLGLVVDNAIVITEALDAARQQKRTQDKQKIIAAAIKRVGLAMSAGTLTTVLVFAPILFVTGILGDFIRILPATVIIALLLSLVIALVFIPFFAAGILLNKRKQPPAPLGSAIDYVRKGVLALPNHLAKAGKKVRSMTVAGAIIVSLSIMGLGGYLLGQLPLNIFPETDDADMIMLQLSFGADTGIEAAQERVEEVNDIIAQELGEDGEIITYPQASAQSATAQVTLRPFTQRDVSSQEYIDRIETRLKEETEVDFSISQIDAGPPAENFPFAAQIRGENIGSTAELAEDIAEFLRTEEITRNDGSVIEIEEVRVSADPGVIRRTDGARFVEIEASYTASDTTGLVTATQSKVEEAFDAERLEGYGLSPEALNFDFGQESQNVESFESTQVALVIALVLMYFLLVIQFNSFSQPVLILLAVPFGLIGVAGGLMWAEHSLSFFVMIGLIGLVGIVVNNAILLVDYANQERVEGAGIYEAIGEAIKQRFRPIVTTTLTTIGALSPLALADPFWEPLAITVIFGLAASTVLILTAFPYFYVVFETAREAKNKRLPFLK